MLTKFSIREQISSATKLTTLMTGKVYGLLRMCKVHFFNYVYRRKELTLAMLLRSLMLLSPNANLR
jgi:hypothetical protein